MMAALSGIWGHVADRRFFWHWLSYDTCLTCPVCSFYPSIRVCPRRIDFFFPGFLLFLLLPCVGGLVCLYIYTYHVHKAATAVSHGCI